YRDPECSHCAQAFSLLLASPPSTSSLSPYTTLFRSVFDKNSPYLPTIKIGKNNPKAEEIRIDNYLRQEWNHMVDRAVTEGVTERSEEHTSELQSRFDLVCRLLLETKNTKRED